MNRRNFSKLAAISSLVGLTPSQIFSTAIYCYDEVEKDLAIEKLSPKPEITRFKGLGEISPNEFKNFIGESIRLDPVIINKETSISEMLSFYMGKNTPERQNFIIDNLKMDIDKL